MSQLNPPALSRQRPRPEARVARPLLAFDLWREANELRLENPWRLHGHNAKTLVKRDDARVVLMILRGGTEIADHHVGEASVAIQSVEGRVHVETFGHEIDLPARHVLFLAPGQTYRLRAIDDASLLFTVG